MARASYCLDAFVELLDQAVRRAQQRCRQRHAAVVNAAAAACDMWAHCVDGEQRRRPKRHPCFPFLSANCVRCGCSKSASFR